MKRVLAGAGAIALSAGLFAAVAPAAHASTLTVAPGAYRTIGAAIAASHSGDTIRVAAGTYRENISIIGKNITLQGASSPGRVIIAGNPGRTPVLIQGVSRAMVFEGFRIVSGNAPAGQGGGITVVNGASPLIIHNQIVSNHSNDGGGILVYNGSNPDIAYNYIENNSVNRFGGGVFAYMGSNPTLHHNVIEGNHAVGGGGVYLEANSGNQAARAGGVITLNTINSNTATEAGGGIMLRTGEVASITHNTISKNRAPYGGGIHIETNGSAPTVSYNTITSNVSPTSTAYSGSGSGGGISVFAQSTPTIANNQIVGNGSSVYGGGIVLAEGSSSRLAANNIQSNQTNTNGTGGGIFVGNASVRAWDNVIQRNHSRLGGGVGLEGTGTAVFINNDFISNVSPNGAPLGGGLYVGKTSVSLNSNLFLANSNYQIFDASSGTGYANNLADQSSQNDFYSYHTASAGTTFAGLNGNPSFTAFSNLHGGSALANPSGGNYYLTARSSAVNRARANGAPSYDYRGAHRPYGGGFDIGAFEFTG